MFNHGKNRDIPILVRINTKLYGIIIFLNIVVEATANEIRNEKKTFSLHVGKKE